MKKVVIFTGGSGSLSIQEGLNMPEVDVTCILNAYDNGKSTGAVRKVADGKILGPSDLRKNQMHRAVINSSVTEDLLSFLDTRMDFGDIEATKTYLYERLNGLLVTSRVYKLFKDAFDAFFDKKEANLIDYIDFSVSNIVYAGLALLNNNSLEKAGEIMQDVLDIGDCVNLISDDSLYLQALTKNGDIVYDEGDIVKWKNYNNPIVGIRLMDIHGNEVIPEISEKVVKKIKDADIIIFSTGTQWSSLIPTYIHKGFYDLIKVSKASKYLFMNNIQDDDMYGKTSEDIIKILETYLPLIDVKIVFNSNATDGMKIKSDKYNCIFEKFSEVGEKVHEPNRLRNFFNKELFFPDTILFNSNIFIFDLDNTLVGKGNEYYPNSVKNLMILKKLSNNYKIKIITGNSLNHLNEIAHFYNVTLSTIDIYVDGGNTKCFYSHETGKFEASIFLDDEWIMSHELVKTISDKVLEAGVGLHKIENRNNNIISIKPLESNERTEVYSKLIKILPQKLECHMTGRTTIDIYMKGYNKLVSIKDRVKTDVITYIGDEIDKGNDSCFKDQDNIYLNRVNNPIDCTRFLEILLNKDL